MKKVILLADTDETVRQELERASPAFGLQVMAPKDRATLLRAVSGGEGVLVVLGSRLRSPGESLDLASRIRGRDREIPIIVVAGDGSEEQLLAALRIGVNDFLKGAFSGERLLASVDRCLQQAGVPEPGAAYDRAGHRPPLIGDSIALREVGDYLCKVASTDSTVLITGETGTGKELAAEIVHRGSSRKSRPFICVNSAALPESLVESELFGYERGAFTGAVVSRRGKFEMAAGGTIFLDEIGDMSPQAQAKILRIIERKELFRIGGRGTIPLDVRVIAATNRMPEELVARGLFREDLYYRLNVARVHMPPLRERKEDIPVLIAHFIGELNHRFGRRVEDFTEKAWAALLQYDWPGNVRELKNLLEAAFINLPSREIAFADLPRTFRERFAATAGLPGNERDMMVAALLTTNWNKSKAAEKLHWSRMTLYRKMAKHRITEKRTPRKRLTDLS